MEENSYKEPTLENPTYASPMARLGAHIITLAITYLVLLVTFILVGVLNEIYGIFLSMAIILAMVVFQFFLAKKRGQSFGMWFLDLQVVDEETRKSVGAWKYMLLRGFVGQALLGAVPLYSLIDGLMVFAEKRKTLHDMIAGTVVLKLEQGAKQRELGDRIYNLANVTKQESKTGNVIVIILAVILPVIATIGILASVVLSSLNTAREKALEAEQQQMQQENQVIEQ